MRNDRFKDETNLFSSPTMSINHDVNLPYTWVVRPIEAYRSMDGLSRLTGFGFRNAPAGQCPINLRRAFIVTEMVPVIGAIKVG